MTRRPYPSWVMRRSNRQPLWVVLLAALPLGVCLGVTVLLNICGG